MKTNSQDQRISASITNSNTNFLSTSEQNLESSNYISKQGKQVKCETKSSSCFRIWCGTKSIKILSDSGKLQLEKVWNLFLIDLRLFGVKSSKYSNRYLLPWIWAQLWKSKLVLWSTLIHLWDNTRLQEKLQLLKTRTIPEDTLFPWILSPL